MFSLTCCFIILTFFFFLFSQKSSMSLCCSCSSSSCCCCCSCSCSWYYSSCYTNWIILSMLCGFDGADGCNNVIKSKAFAIGLSTLALGFCCLVGPVGIWCCQKIVSCVGRMIPPGSISLGIDLFLFGVVRLLLLYVDKVFLFLPPFLPSLVFADWCVLHLPAVNWLTSCASISHLLVCWLIISLYLLVYWLVVSLSTLVYQLVVFLYINCLSLCLYFLYIDWSSLCLFL